MKPCVFCQGMAGEVPLHIVWEDADCVAFLDHKPVFAGHTLLVPRRHQVCLHELRESEAAPLFSTLRVLSQAVPRALNAEGSFVANNNVVSQSVPHLHWHVVPRKRKDGLRGFFWPRTHYTDDAHIQDVQSRVQGVVSQELILDFWFGVPTEDGTSPNADRWWRKDPELDRRTRQRFGSLVERALSGELDDWKETPRGRLALILLLDQLTRNLFRGEARQFAGDERARELALDADETGLSRDQRSFLYMPFEHGEDTRWQNLSLEKFGQLAQEEPRFEFTLGYARMHADLIDRFGRFPHRNAQLGRETTPEEAAYLAGPDAFLG